MKKAEQKKLRLGLTGFALFLLIIPGVNIYDLFPDFIAYFLFCKAISYSADRAPYFAEAKDAFFKLGIVTLIKIPASLAMSFIRSSNAEDSDIRALFSFTFAVIEFILIFVAVRNLFLGFTYLGERTSNSSFIKDFSVNKSGSIMMSTDGVRNLTYAFALYRCLMYFLPELLLLTRGVSAEEYFTTFNIARLYPYAVIFSISTLLIFGIFWQSRIKKYLRSIKAEGGLSASADQLMTEERCIELQKEKKLSRMKLALSAVALAAILSAELRFENLRNIDLFPSFVFGFVIMFAAGMLASSVRSKKLALAVGGAYTGIAVITYLFDFTFFKSFSYSDITLFPDAKSSYKHLIVARSIETAVFILVMITLCYILVEFIKNHTGIEPNSNNYSIQDRDYHRKMTTLAFIFCGLGIFCQLARLADCIFKYYSKTILVSVENSIGTVSEGLIPWFGVLVIILEILYIGFTLYIVSSFKEELELKYS